MKRVWALAAQCAACAARSEITGGAGELGDASTIHPLDASSVPDGSTHSDGSTGIDAGGCTPAEVGIGCAGPGDGDCDKYGCKFYVTSTCGGTTETVSGACAPADAGFQSGNGVIYGACSQDGKQTSTFTVDTTTCDCKQDQSLITLVQGLCTHQ